MRKIKSMLLYALLALFIFSVVNIAANIVISDAQAEVISPYEQDAELALSVSYAGGQLTLNTTGGPLPEDADAYQYQYWIMDKVETDETEGNEVREQYIWQLARGYEKAKQYVITDGAQRFPGIFLSDDENYNIIVRVQDSNGNVIDELYGAYAPEQIGKPVIGSVTVNGREVYDDYIVISKTTSLNIKINANITGLSYSVQNGNATLASSPTSGDFTGVNAVNINSLNAGQHILEVKAQTTESVALKKIKLYVVDEYIADERPVIDSLTGTDAVNGAVSFTMKVRYADRSEMTADDIGNFTYKLKSGNTILDSQISMNGISVTANTEDDMLDVVFSVNYGSGKYGIYQTIGEVSRKNISGADDKAILYYDGYATRVTSLSQEAVSAGYNSGTGTYTAGVPIVITAEGSITGATGNTKFAFYREDASGWVLIRDYKTLAEAADFTWTPVRPGTYNIQARIMDDNAGSYEKTVTNTYVIDGGNLTGDLSIKFYNYATGNETNTLIAGNPYKIEAIYEEEIDEEKVRLDDVLYMFTLSSQKLGTIYLNKFNASPYYIFVPGCDDSFKITARVIKMTSFGYKDISFSRDFETLIQIPYFLEFEQPGIYYSNQEAVSPIAKLYLRSDNSELTDADITYELKDNANQEYDITDGKFTLPYGNFTLTANVQYMGFEIVAEITVSVLRERELQGAIQIFDSVGDLGIGVKPDGINIGNSGFDTNLKRTALSEGSAYIDSGSGQYPNLFMVNPIITKQEFVDAMNEEGAYMSMWVYITSSLSSIDVRFVIDWGSYIERITTKNQWVNVKLTKARILQAGFASLDAYYDTISSSGRFMFINNLSSSPKECRIFFDNIFVVKDGTININMPQTEFEINDEIEIVATSNDADEFVYEVSAGIETRYYDTPVFTPWTIGSTVVTVRPVYGNINASATITLTVTGERKLEGALQYFDGEGDLGIGVKPDGVNVGNSGFSSAIKRTAISEGSAYIDTGTGQYPNLFITNPIMSKQDFVAAMNEVGAYMSMWVYVETAATAIDLRFTIDWKGTVQQVTTKNQWVNIKLTKARILAADSGFASLDAYYDTIASAGRFMFIDNLSSPTRECRIYFDSIYVAKDGAITIDMPVTEYNINDEIEIVATSNDVDTFVYEVTAGGETRYYDIPTFTPWVAGNATVRVRSAYGNINALATVNLTITA